jgi:hypothetical protein
MAELVEAAEVVEGVVEDVVDVARTFGPLAIVVTAGLGVVAGGGAGYFLAEKRLRLKYEQLAEAEIEEMREHYRARLLAKEEQEKPDLETKIQDLGYGQPAPAMDGPWPKSDPPIPVEDEEIEEVHNVFTDAVEWDQEAENALRKDKKIYVIHVDERGETGFDDTTLTYYEGDDVLAGSDDRVISEVDELVGLENLDRFGHGSNDPAIVYIRNIDHMLEIEVVKSPGTYAEEVHGLQHMDEQHERPRRWDG